MKKFLINISCLIALSVALFTGCQQEELFLPEELAAKVSSEKRSIFGDDYLGNPGGVFVLAEGNMTTENGTLSFIDASNIADFDFPAQSKVYGDSASGAMGNVSQDLFIANNKMYVVAQNGDRMGILPQTKHLLELDNTLTYKGTFNPGNYFPTAWSTSYTPTHLAVVGSTIYVRTNGGVVITDTTYFSTPTAPTPPTPISGIKTPSRTRMAMVKTNGVKYLYVGSENDTVYRINTSDTTVSNIPVEGAVAGMVAVRRDNKTDQYVYALGILSSTQAMLSKIRDTVVATYLIDIPSAPFDPALFTPSVGLCCYSGGAQDILYFRANTFYPDPTEIFRYGTATGQAEVLYSINDEIDVNAQLIYGDLGVDQRNGDLYFGYVGTWEDYYKVNGIGRLRRGNPNSIRDYGATYTPPYQIDTRFTAAIYFRDDFEM
jgi:hypothetical protein